MQFQQPFDARGVDPSQVSVPIQPGDYKTIISASEPKETNDKSGAYLEFTVKLLEGPNVGREFPYRLNLWNANPQASQIAYKQLSALCHVCGVFHIQDSSQLHNIPFISVIGLQKNDPNYNEIKGVKDIHGNNPGKAAAPTAAAPAAAPPPAYAPPAPAAPAAAPWSPAPASAPAAAPPWGAQPAAQPAATAPAPAWPAPAPAAPVAAAPDTRPPWAR